MISKRFLVPVLALMGWGLPVGASVVSYCDGNGCGADTMTQFATDLTSDSYSLQGLTTFSNADLAGSIYTDTTTLIVFTDLHGSDQFTVSGGTLETKSEGNDSVGITLPSAYVALELSLSVESGFGYLCLYSGCNTYVNLSTTPILVGFIGDSSLLSLQLAPTYSGGGLVIDSFNAAITGDTGGGGDGGGSPTPEVATFLLIGFGLIAMRWMHRLPRRFLPRRLQPA